MADDKKFFHFLGYCRPGDNSYINNIQGDSVRAEFYTRGELKTFYVCVLEPKAFLADIYYVTFSLDSRPNGALQLQTHAFSVLKAFFSFLQAHSNQFPF